jgi:hypothetical protein
MWMGQRRDSQGDARRGRTRVVCGMHSTPYDLQILHLVAPKMAKSPASVNDSFHFNFTIE